MDEKKLKEIIKKGETIEVELKQSFSSSQETAKTICAFANTQGGIIIIGANAKGEIVGIQKDLDEIQQRISAANSTVHPKPIITAEVMEIEKKSLIVLTVHKAGSSVFHSVEGVVFVRFASTTQRLDGQSILEFLRNRQILLFEESIESSAKVSDLDLNKIRPYLEKRKQADYLSKHSLNDFLVSKKLVTEEMKIKNIALLFFAKELQSFHPHIQVKLVRFDGMEPIKVIAYEDAKGSLPEMIEQSANFVKRFISKEFIIKGLKREEILLLPEEAVREAIINSVAHRDYFNKNEIQLSIFDDRVEITNPGGLPEGMTEEMLGALSVQRNPIVYQFLKDYGYMEGIGSGISKIYDSMMSSNLQKPEFPITKSFFRIVLRIKKKEDVELAAALNLNKRQVKAIEYLRINKKIQTKEHAAMNKISIAGALKDLKKLEMLKLIKKIGTFRGAYYILIPKRAKKNDYSRKWD